MQVMTRYTVKRGRVEENLDLTRALYAEYASVRPAGLREATFQLADEVGFLTFAELEDGPEQLRELDAFQRFRAHLDERCDAPPVPTLLHEVGSFGFR